MARFDSAIKLAQRLIKKNGHVAQWHNLGEIVPLDVEKPWLGGETQSVIYDVNICFIPVENKDERKLFQYLTGTEVQIGRLAGLMGAVGFLPTAEDYVMRSGTQLRIKTLDVLKPNNQILMYTIEFSG